MNDKKQLECYLRCKASDNLEESIIEDMCKSDACLKDILKEQEQNEQIENNSKNCS